jgi:hypothetical protein
MPLKEEHPFEKAEAEEVKKLWKDTEAIGSRPSRN